MKYDFTSIIERHGKDATAVEAIGDDKLWGNEPDTPQEGFDFIPMWVADMNFATAPAVSEAIIARAEHPLFGYFRTPDSYFESISRWQEQQFGVKGPDRSEICYMNGVHGAVTSVIRAFTQPGDGILIHSPMYIGFFGDIENLGRVSVCSALKQDENGVWRMDYADMDAKIKQNHIRVALLCTPHNPCGRVWERWELEKAMQVYEANDCVVICDEIWSDLVYSGAQHIPGYAVNEWAAQHSVCIYAPSKTFNLAGLIGSYAVIKNEQLRETVNSSACKTNFNEQNVLSMHALLGAYSEEGKAWSEELKQVLEQNCRYACERINRSFPGVSVSMPQGTYMIFLDCSGYCEKTGRSLDDIISAGWRVGVGWQDGRRFVAPCHIRMNLASPFSQIEKALNRLEQYVFVD